jgi:hypothetical protein
MAGSNTVNTSVSPVGVRMPSLYVSPVRHAPAAGSAGTAAVYPGADGGDVGGAIAPVDVVGKLVGSNVGAGVLVPAVVGVLVAFAPGVAVLVALAPGVLVLPAAGVLVLPAAGELVVPERGALVLPPVPELPLAGSGTPVEVPPPQALKPAAASATASAAP